MYIVHDKISLAELRVMSEKMFGKMVKGVIDIELEIIKLVAQLVK